MDRALQEEMVHVFLDATIIAGSCQPESGDGKFLFAVVIGIFSGQGLDGVVLGACVRGGPFRLPLIGGNGLCRGPRGLDVVHLWTVHLQPRYL